jgi:hypothetical protein
VCSAFNLKSYTTDSCMCDWRCVAQVLKVNDELVGVLSKYQRLVDHHKPDTLLVGSGASNGHTSSATVSGRNSQQSASSHATPATANAGASGVDSLLGLDDDIVDARSASTNSDPWSAFRQLSAPPASSLPSASAHSVGASASQSNLQELGDIFDLISAPAPVVSQSTASSSSTSSSHLVRQQLESVID